MIVLRNRCVFAFFQQTLAGSDAESYLDKCTGALPGALHVDKDGKMFVSDLVSK